MGDSKADWSRHGGMAMLSACIRLLGSLLGGIIAFAVWLVAVLVRMPRPPVPPSFAVTLTAPVVTAAGFGLGGAESYPGVFGDFGGFADDARIEHGAISLSDRPGIGFEGQARLYRIMRELAGL